MTPGEIVHHNSFVAALNSHHDKVSDTAEAIKAVIYRLNVLTVVLSVLSVINLILLLKK